MAARELSPSADAAFSSQEAETSAPTITPEPPTYEWQAVLQIGHAGAAIHEASLIAYWANAEPSVRRMHMEVIAAQAARVAELIAKLQAPEVIQ